MGTRVWTALSTAVLVLSLAWVRAEAVSRISATVVHITDGDTVVVRIPGRSEHAKIRMLGMDTPETWPQRGEDQQPWGGWASDELHRLLHVGDKVSIQSTGTDHYGRMLAWVFRGNTDINLEVVKAGWAVPYLFCDGKSLCDSKWLKSYRAADYVQACKRAKSKGLGIFHPTHPLQEMPIEFRRRTKAANGKYRPDKVVADLETGKYYRPATSYDDAPVDYCSRLMFSKESDARALGFEPAK